MHRLLSIRKAACGVAVLLCMGVVAPALASQPAGAAGITTHAWMATTAVDKVTVPQLKALLKANIGQVYAGAQFPDSGYLPGNTYGEEAHWQRFYDSYAHIIMTKPGCGALTNPTGPCAAEIAHMMGAIAHGMGDEVWDWLFEPESVDLNEYYLPAAFGSYADAGGQELQMDIAAIGLYGRVNPVAPPIPSKPDILAALDAAGFHGATAAQLDFGQLAQSVIHRAEANLAAAHTTPLRAAMPYLSANLVTEPGGVDFAARAIAAEWESMWGRLLDNRPSLSSNEPSTKVSVTYPADGQRRVPATGWVRSYSPGSSPGRGGARTRIAAALTYSLPYVPATGGPNTSANLAPNTMTLREKATGKAVPIMSGYPRAVPYGADAGEHMVDIQPAADLSPCTWYTAGVSAALKDERQQPVVPSTWSFRTGAASGGPCADDPMTQKEAWIVKVQLDLRGVTLSPADLATRAYRLDRDMDRVPAATEAVGSVEYRRLLVAGSYRSYLGRAPTDDEREQGAVRVSTESLTPLRSEILGSSEFFSRSGGRNSSFVSAAYLKVTGQQIGAVDLATWTDQLDHGGSRTSVAAVMLRSDAGARQLIGLTTLQLLNRPATSAEVVAWTARVSAADERVLAIGILSGDEYLARAQVNCSSSSSCPR